MTGGRVQIDRLDRLAERDRTDQDIREARPGWQVELLGDRRATQIDLEQQPYPSAAASSSASTRTECGSVIVR